MRQTLPELWLVSDERNDGVLEAALRRLPRGSALIYRHYHLPPAGRLARFRTLARIANSRSIAVILADSAQTALEWRAQGAYAAPLALTRRRGVLRIATAHSLREIAQANRTGADAVLLSPAFPTRSHPEARALGPLRFRLIAGHAAMPVIALGGMTPRHARRLQWRAWAAIDGLS